MCEIDITDFVTNTDTWKFSGSIATHGPNAEPNTWNNAVREATESPLLKTEEELDALRQWAKETGAWDDEHIAAWSPEECNALFIQLVSGDMREAGMDNYDVDEFDWEDYQQRAEEGQISGNVYRSSDRIFYYLGN